MLRFVFLLSTIILLSSCSSLPHDCGTMEPPLIPPANTEGFKLVQVSIIFRHGDRIMYQGAPCWPNDLGEYHCRDRFLSYPSFLESKNTTSSGVLYRKNYMNNRNYYKGSCEIGQLTNRGYIQEFNVGKMYKKFYVDSGFLSSSFDPKQVYLRSDEGDRCVQSLQNILQGMFPTEATSPEYKVFDINTMDSYYDNITPNSNICPIYGKFRDDAFQTPSYREYYDRVVVPLYANLTAALGFDVHTQDDISQIHDCFVVHACHQQPIPSGVTPELFNQVIEVTDYSFKALYDYPDPQTNAQAGIGYFLEELISQILPAMNLASGPVYKMLFYSGHDTTLLPLLNAFGQWDGVWSPYASQIQFELYQNQADSSYSIRIAYNGRNVQVPGCSSALCPWKDFYSFAETRFPTGNCSISSF